MTTVDDLVPSDNDDDEEWKTSRRSRERTRANTNRELHVMELVAYRSCFPLSSILFQHMKSKKFWLSIPLTSERPIGLFVANFT